MADEGNDGAAVNGGKVGVEQGQAVLAQQDFDVVQIVVEQVFVVDLVEGDVLYDALHVQERHDKDAARSKAFLDAACDGVQLFQVEEYARGIDHLEVAAQRPGEVVIEEGVHGGHAILVGDCG